MENIKGQHVAYPDLYAQLTEMRTDEEINRRVFDKISSFEKLVNRFEKTLENSGSKLEFFGRIQAEINRFRNLGYEDLHFYIDIPRDAYRNFFSILAEVDEDIEKIPKHKKYGKIETTRNGEYYEFKYEYYLAYMSIYSGMTYIFQVWEEGRDEYDKFSFQLKIMDNGQDLKVVDLFPDVERYYLGKGISIAMILCARKIFNKRIISSSNRFRTFESEQRFDDATNKVWKRLVDHKLAKYNEALDYFYTIK